MGCHTLIPSVLGLVGCVFFYSTAFVVCGVLPARGIDNEALKNSSYGKQYLTKYITDDAPAADGASKH